MLDIHALASMDRGLSSIAQDINRYIRINVLELMHYLLVVCPFILPQCTFNLLYVLLICLQKLFMSAAIPSTSTVADTSSSNTHFLYTKRTGRVMIRFASFL